MIQGILGRKIGMTQVFAEDGRVVPVTVVEAGPCTVTQVRTRERDGYEAVQLGYEEVGRVDPDTPLKEQKRQGRLKRVTLPEAGHLRRVGILFRHLREVPVEGLGEVQVGQRVTVEIFRPGEQVDVTGRSKGRGFTGVVKRHGFAGGPKTHGQSDRHRAPGSVGATTFPGRTLPGLRMAGHWGDERVTVRNLEVVRVDPERNLLFLKGAVPGPRNGLLIIRKAKKPKRRGEAE